MPANKYDVLLVPRHATRETIKESYNRLARMYHPDKNPGCAAIVRPMFEAVQSAWETLRDDRAKAAYDASLPPHLPADDQEQQQQQPQPQPEPEPDPLFDPTTVTTNAFCGDFFAGKCWGMGCTKVHAGPRDFWVFMTRGEMTTVVVDQLNRSALMMMMMTMMLMLSFAGRFLRIERLARQRRCCFEWKCSRCFDAGCAFPHPTIVVGREFDSPSLLRFRVYAGKCVVDKYKKEWYTNMRAHPLTPLTAIMAFVRKRMKVCCCCCCCRSYSFIICRQNIIPVTDTVHMHTWWWTCVYHGTEDEKDKRLRDVDDLEEAGGLQLRVPLSPMLL